MEEGGGEEGEASAQSLAIARVLAYLDNDSSRFLGLVINMLASRDQWLRHSRAGVDLDGAQAALRILIAQELETIARVLPAGMQDALMPVGRFAASQVLLGQSCGDDLAELAAISALEHWSQPLPAAAESLPQWRALAELLLTKGGEIRAQLPAKLGFAKSDDLFIAVARTDVTLRQLQAAVRGTDVVPDDKIVGVEIPTGNPLEIELDADLKPTAVRYLDQSRAEALPPLQ